MITRSNLLVIMLSIAASMLGSLLLIIYMFSKNIGLIQSENKPEQEICQEDTFTIKDFVLELHIQEIKYPDIILRQASLESGWFKSGIWKEKNNPFGFRYKGEYILFNDWKSSVAYMKNWQDKYYKGGPYYDFLEKLPYAEDTNYVQTLKNMDLNNLKNK